MDSVKSNKTMASVKSGYSKTGVRLGRPPGAKNKPKVAKDEQMPAIDEDKDKEHSLSNYDPFDKDKPDEWIVN